MIEVIIEDADQSFHPHWAATTIRADAKSVDFSTQDKDGGELEPSFELTWEEIFKACQEYSK